MRLCDFTSGDIFTVGKGSEVSMINNEAWMEITLVSENLFAVNRTAVCTELLLSRSSSGHERKCFIENTPRFI
ncbi:hypothetical protein EJ377_00470 [Chryseobacterium arthrosphaerae]|uniref:Uncharacterized protein n=1 Tax=Chryseobacterium arthrosphaerae TaxID=651561 RepID=A0A3S0QHS9_9FLAO|nr:hypothetical protein EJ377_00470 [Chryseobacterium arthrosphaerae]